MAKITPLAKFILSFEGGFSNHPNDKGGPTNRGVTIATWRAQGYDKDGDGDIDVQDLKLITEEDATNIMRNNYWNRWKADEIHNQAIANLLVDWVWASGRYGITIPQQVLGVKADGIVGPKTIAAVNSEHPGVLFLALKERRKKYIQQLVKNNPEQKVFINGWLRRLNNMKFSYLIDNKDNKIYW